MGLFSKRKILVILGPTGTGKTDLALKLAKRFNGELISCDSRQVYVGLDIGTGKLPSQVQNSNVKTQMSKLQKGQGWWLINGVRIWMYDVVSPRIQYTVADYARDANKVIREIRERGKLPIVVGGTGLYLKALTFGLSNLSVPVDKNLRKKLEKLSLKELQEKLQTLSIKRWEKMNQSDRGNPRRLIRAIELETSLRRSPYGHLRSVSSNRDILKVGLIAPREVLYKRVDDRVVERIKQGMIEEAVTLHKKGLTFKRMKQLGLEYGVLAEFLSGEIRDIEGDKGLIKLLQNKIHGFVRRQRTWFKREKNVRWFDITERKFPNNVEKLVYRWYYQTDATKD